MITPKIYEQFDSKETINAIWGHASSRLGFLTSVLQDNHNIMTVEWISQVQFKPPLMAVSLVHGSLSIEQVKQSKEFGLCFASQEQLSHIKALGRSSGKDVNKYEEFNLSYEPGSRIASRMFLGGLMAVECRVRDVLELDTSSIFVGEVIFAKLWDRLPLGYHQGGIFSYGENLLTD